VTAPPAERIWRQATWAGLLTIAVLSLAPLAVPGAAHASDKLVHALTYGLLTGVCARGYRALPLARVGGGVFLYGLALEGLQSLTGYRTASAADALANAIGISIMLVPLGFARHPTRR